MAYGDGLGSGGGSTTNGSSKLSATISILESKNCCQQVVLIYCIQSNVCILYANILYVGPTASLFDNLNINLGTPNGTYSNAECNC
jgi:hypothetical protein